MLANSTSFGLYFTSGFVCGGGNRGGLLTGVILEGIVDLTIVSTDLTGLGEAMEGLVGVGDFFMAATVVIDDVTLGGGVGTTGEVTTTKVKRDH